MNYIVVDLEWNQGIKTKTQPPLAFEIIEIGAVKLDDSLNPVDNFHRIIRPVIYPKLFSHTKKIISLTEEELKNGIPFKQAYSDFIKWCKKDGDFLFVTWGTLDLYELQRNMEFYKIKNPFQRPLYYIDAQLLYNIFLGKSRDNVASLEHAAKQFLLPINKSFHSAPNDAEYTAMLVKHLPKDYLELYPSVDIFKYPIYKKQEAYIQYPDFSFYVSRAYKTKEALKLASGIRPLFCPICNRKAQRITPWYSSCSKTFFMLGKCKNHGYLKAKRVIKNPCEKRFFETIFIKTVTETEKERFIAACKKKN